MKQFYECEIVRDERGYIIYNDDCVVTILELGTIKSYPNRDFQSVAVVGVNGTKVSNVSISYGKSDPKLTPEDINKPLPCRIKVEEDNSQYSVNGRKYTFIIGSKNTSGSSNQSQGSSYQQKQPINKDVDWDEIARGKIRTCLVAAVLQRQDAVDLHGINVYVEYCMTGKV